jgi:hypothetical protein
MSGTGLTGRGRLMLPVLIMMGMITAFLIFASNANAALTNYFNQSYTGNRSDYTGTVGYEFIPRQNITVTALGRSVSGTMNANHSVRIWKTSDRSLVASATVTSSSPRDSFGYAYETLAFSITLTTGITYRIASTETAGGDSWRDIASINNHSSIADISGGVFGDNTYPDRTWGSGNEGYVPVTFFTDTAGSTPTPTLTPTPTPGSVSFVSSLTTGGQLRNDFGNYAGMMITVGSSPITIKELGRYFVPGNTGTHTVKIVDGNGSDVIGGGVNINMSQGSADSLGYKYAALATPVTLTANQSYYLVSLETAGGDLWYGFTTLPTLATTPVAAVINGIYYYNGGWRSYGSTGNSYCPLNFKYESANTPTPSSTPTPGLSITKPTSYSVLQRSPGDTALMPVAGSYYCATNNVTKIEARAMVMPGGTGTNSNWQTISSNPNGTSGNFNANITVSKGGWYNIEVRCLDSASNSVLASNVQKVGVGEVFITAGQSNSCCFSENKLIPNDDRVTAVSCDINDYNWRFAQDPLPSVPSNLTYGQGTGGSPWPSLGERLVTQLGVPVGFISCGEGGTSVLQWQPDGVLYPRIKAALLLVGINGARAILWHQGESDASNGTPAVDYQQRLTNVINQSRSDAGWNIPWGVAVAAWSPWATQTAIDNVHQGQYYVISSVSNVFQGAYTDDLITGYRDSSQVHFNEAGLREHARRWFDILVNKFY